MMAGLLNRNGLCALRFVNERGERKTLALGTRSERPALSIKLKIENLLAASGSSQAADPETVTWLADLKSPFGNGWSIPN